jgi:hypothetical protein
LAIDHAETLQLATALLALMTRKLEKPRIANVAPVRLKK